MIPIITDGVISWPFEPGCRQNNRPLTQKNVSTSKDGSWKIAATEAIGAKPKLSESECRLYLHNSSLFTISLMIPAGPPPRPLIMTYACPCGPKHMRARIGIQRAVSCIIGHNRWSEPNCRAKTTNDKDTTTDPGQDQRKRHQRTTNSRSQTRTVVQSWKSPHRPQPSTCLEEEAVAKERGVRWNDSPSTHQLWETDCSVPDDHASSLQCFYVVQCFLLQPLKKSYDNVALPLIGTAMACSIYLRLRFLIRKWMPTRIP